MKIEELSVYELEEIILNSFITHKMHSGDLPDYSEDDLSGHGIFGGDEPSGLTFDEVKKLKKEMLAIIQNAVNNHAHIIIEKVCKILLSGDADAAIAIVKEIAKTYLSQDMGFSVDELVLSYFLIKSEFIMNICSNNAETI